MFLKISNLSRYSRGARYSAPLQTIFPSSTEEYPSRTPFRLTLTRAFANGPSEPAIGHQTFLLLAPAEVFIRNVYLQPVALT